MADDSELIAAALTGDERAFASLVRRYEDVVAATIIGMLGPGDEADEAGQETMIKLHRSLKTFKGEASLQTYVTRIAMNTALDALRRRKRRFLRYPPATEGDNWLETVPAEDDHAKDYETRQIVTRALGALSTEHRAVAVLRLVQGYSTHEVASLLNVAHGTVLSRLSRAKRQLNDLLKEHLQND